MLNLNKKSLVKNLGLIFIGMLIISVVWVYSVPSSNTFYLSEGAYPQASYTVWGFGSNYYAKNINGLIEFSGTNATDVIQNAMESGSHVYLSEGHYVLYYPLVYVNDTILEGAGCDTAPSITSDSRGTVIRTGSGFGANPIIQPSTAYDRNENFVLKDLTLWADFDATIGFDMGGVHETLIENVAIDMDSRANSIGIYLHNNSVLTYPICTYNTILRPYIRNCDTGIEFEGYVGGGVNENEVTGGFIHGSITNGIVFGGTTAGLNTVMSMSIEGAYQYGIVLNGTAGGNRIIANYIELTHADSTAIWIGSNNNYILYNQASAQNNSMWIQSVAYRTMIATTYDNYYIQDDGVYTYHVNLIYGAEMLIKRTHPSVGGWGTAQVGWYWYCTTHDDLEYFNGTDAVQVIG